MNKFNLHKLYMALLTIGVCTFSTNAISVPFIQCPGDDLLSDGVTPGSDGVPEITSPDYDPNVKCMHLSSGDGFLRMADGRELYSFGFGDITGTDEIDSIVEGTLFANAPAPSIVLEEGQQFYLTLTNVGMVMRPDLFDPHTVHFHGFPNASAIFDGVPDNSISINTGSSLTYFYNIVEPGTFMYHCHVEAAEHMQMGMLGNLYVKPSQNKLPNNTPLGSHTHLTGDQYVFNDGDGSTYYDVEYPIQLSSFDPIFHDNSQNVQPLPFADMEDTYPLINGRGYPDTLAVGGITPPTQNGNRDVQGVPSLVEATVGEKILLRVSSLVTTDFFSIRVLGLDMEVISRGAKQLRTSAGVPNHYLTSTITLGGGEAVDVLIDTTNVAPGTYYLYTTNLNFLSNDTEDYGGMMTEIVISAGGA